MIAPSAAFRRSAWIAMAGLLLFVAVYLGLIGYLVWVIGRLWSSGELAAGALLSLPALFFLGFLVRGLFLVKHSSDPASIEVERAEQPRLFAFLDELAAATGAPRPHRVFVSARVNAAVFYDLSFRNLIFPSKKNLEIGLGLVDVLSLDEMKAVVAHEFGHFAQKTMAVGRWVYIAHQIAGHVVFARSGFDKFLDFLSHIDLRVAWAGWIMRVFVWAIRAVLDTFLIVVVAAHRALGRHMEFQADRVAVSVSGSDSLIHALHRLGPADEAWSKAVQFASEEIGEGRPVEDLFAIQSAILVHLRRILDDASFGQTPSAPRAADGAHRVFESNVADAPRMWATHPPNREREDHAKAIYLASSLDPRSAWELFDDTGSLRKRVTRALFAPRTIPGQKPAEPAPPSKEPVPIAESLARLEDTYVRASLDPRYRGAYLGRSVAGYHEHPKTMVGAVRDAERGSVLTRLSALYPDSLRDLLKSYRQHREEEALLEGLADGFLTAPGGVLRHRGREIRRRELPLVIADVKADRYRLEQSLVKHDVECRAAYLDAATALGGGWASYLLGLNGLLHYATHGARSLSDAHSYLHHVLSIVLADGSVSRAERKWLLAVAGELYDEITMAWNAHAGVGLPTAVAERFAKRGGYKGLSQKLGLNAPTDANLGDWLKYVDGWAGEAAADLGVLAQATLDVLLEVELYVGEHHEMGTDPGTAPSPGTLPKTYPKCVVGNERPRQKRLDLWDRFQVADGFFPGLARFVVASAVLAPAMFVAGHVGSATIVAHNGLDVAVDVEVDGRTERVAPGGHVEFEHGDEDVPVRIRTLTARGVRIESLHIDSPRPFQTYVYNVANASVLNHWNAVYGTPVAALLNDDRVVGAPRIYEADEDYVLVTPPSQVSSSGSGERKSVVSAVTLTDAPASAQRAVVEDARERRALVESHLRFDAFASRSFLAWLELLDRQDVEPLGIAKARAESAPFDVEVERILDFHLPAAAATERCAARGADAARLEGDADRLYLALRCLPDSAERDERILDARARFPTNGFIAYSSGFALGKHGEYVASVAAFLDALSFVRSNEARERSALEATRAHRAAVHAGVPDAGALPEIPDEGSRSILDAWLRVEGPPAEDDTPFVRAYRNLHEGRLEAALAGAHPPGDVDDHLTVLVAASDGAPGPLVERALRLDVHELEMTELLLVAALLAREGRDTSAVEAPIAEALERGHAQPIGHALVEALRVRDAAAIEALAAKLELQFRVLVLAAGRVAMGEAAPAAWRDEVLAVAFAVERPYFR